MNYLVLDADIFLGLQDTAMNEPSELLTLKELTV